MKAILEDHVIADSDDIVECGGYAYFPSSAVRMEWLEKAKKTPSDRACPHGVQFYDVVDGKRTGVRNAWSYEKPRAAMKKVDHWIGFWDQVEIVRG